MSTESKPAASRFDPNFTQHVLDTTGPGCPPREKLVINSLIKHIHDWAREIELSIDEWNIGVKFVNSIGQGSDDKRNEGHRICDVIGLESLVDEIAHKLATENGTDPTSSSILGPFWSPNAPWRELGASIVQDPTPGGFPTLMSGKVSDLVTGKGIPNATFDIWQASSNGKYDFQDPENQSDNNLRGKFKTDANGDYHFYCLKPTAYSLPTDGAAGVLLKLLDRHPMRPAHIHLMISAEGYKPVTTQIFPADDPYLETDTVFAVKDDLVVEFTPRKNDPKAGLDLHFSAVLAPRDFDGVTPLSQTTIGLAGKL